MTVTNLDDRPGTGTAPVLDPADAPAPWTAPDAGPPDPLPAAPPVVLVVDDDEDARDTLAVLLRSHGMSVLQAATGAAALEVASLLPLSAVLLDVMLPDGSGFDVCRALRARADTQNLPVIMLTALTGVTDEVTGVLAGADAFVVKPASRERLLLHLQDLI